MEGRVEDGKGRGERVEIAGPGEDEGLQAKMRNKLSARGPNNSGRHGGR
jgi:hypothetical protein